jgi:hypothetical protein
MVSFLETIASGAASDAAGVADTIHLFEILEPQE